MKINQTMLDLLTQIKVVEPARKCRKLNVPAKDLGNRLIEFYYQTNNLESRMLIKAFLSEAGFVWLRKLITRDTKPVLEAARVATMDEYVALAAANEPCNDWGMYAH